MKTMKSGKVVTGVLNDMHYIGLSIIEHALLDAGFEVVKLGTLASAKDFIDAATEVNAQAILVSSSYGMAEIDAKGFREMCEEAGLKNIVLYIGGTLVVGKREWSEVVGRFTEMGFNRVYPPGTLPGQVIIDLKKDLKIAA
jgi:methylaspartate mutase sigma subunit